jgi:two-component system OmpR family response regulator
LPKLLVVDDDPRLLELLAEYLGGRAFDVVTAPDGEKGLDVLRGGGIDLVVLDVMLPGKDGFEVCREIRKTSRIPVVMLTARGDDTDRIVGLEIGADDYLQKPFNPRELLARINAVMRRTRDDRAGDNETFEAAGIRVDTARREATVGGQPIDLTTTEFDILRALVSSAGRVIPRERLMELARGEEWAAYDRGVDVHISHLRRKLGDDSRQPKLIKTVRGIGYLVPKA